MKLDIFFPTMKIDFFFFLNKERTLQYVLTLILFIYFFNRKLKCLLQVLILDPSNELKQSDLSQHQTLPINIILNNIFSYCSESNPDEFNYTLLLEPLKDAYGLSFIYLF